MENQNELRHYGVIGMKWGVRRYQNKDGSYTRAGVARYKKAEANYDSAHAARKRAANSHNAAAYKADIDKTASRKEQRKQHRALRKESYERYKVTRKEEKEAKKTMNRAYKQLKLDAKADKGAERYRNGETIAARKAAVSSIGTAGLVISAGGAFIGAVTSPGYSKTADAMKLVGASLIGSSWLGELGIIKGNSEMRAYYGHESQKALDKKVFGDKKTSNPYNRTPMDEKYHAPQSVGHAPTIDELRKKYHYGI